MFLQERGSSITSAVRRNSRTTRIQRKKVSKLAAGVAEEGRKSAITADGRGSPRLHDYKLNKEVVNIFLKDYEECQQDIEIC